MTGTILAVLATFWITLRVAPVLLASREPKRAPKAVETPSGPITDTVTRAEFEAFKKDVEQRTEWVLDEWYEKFQTLHARLSKRASRAAQSAPPPQVGEPEPQPSVLQFRRMGSP